MYTTYCGNTSILSKYVHDVHVALYNTSCLSTLPVKVHVRNTVLSAHVHIHVFLNKCHLFTLTGFFRTTWFNSMYTNSIVVVL